MRRQETAHEFRKIVRRRFAARDAGPDDVAPFEIRRGYPGTTGSDELADNRPDLTAAGRRLDAQHGERRSVDHAPAVLGEPTREFVRPVDRPFHMRRIAGSAGGGQR